MTSARDELQRTANRYRQQVAAIRADDTLSTKGKRQQLEQLYTDTNTRATELRRQMEKGTYQTRSTLERQLFGLAHDASSSDAISYRDALDRVAAIKDPHQLGELMERAHTSGDDMLLRAAFGHAYRQSRGALASEHWSGLVAEYVENNPRAGRDLAELDSYNTRRGQALAEAVTTSIAKPTELDQREPVEPDAAAAA